MKMKKSLLCLLFSSLFVCSCSNTKTIFVEQSPVPEIVDVENQEEKNDQSNSVPSSKETTYIAYPDFDLEDYQMTDFRDLGTPRIAGASTTYSDGTIKYLNTGSTVGYKLANNSIILDYYLTYQVFAGSCWFAINLRATDFARTHSSSLESLGYVFMFYPDGTISLSKSREAIETVKYRSFVAGERYDVQMGAVDVENGTVVVLYIDGVEVFNFFDNNEPLTNGNWIIIAGDAALGYTVNATLEPKAELKTPTYETYTYSTIRECLTRGGLPIATIDVYNNIVIYSGTQTIGFDHGFQNFSLAGNYMFTKIESGSSLFLNLRADVFSRLSGISTGYSIGLKENGITIYRRNNIGSFTTLKTATFNFEINRNYYIEFGAVDYSEDETRIFIKIDDDFVLEAQDINSPYQQPGWVDINPEGTFLVTIGSEIRALNPLKHKVVETEHSKIFKLFFDAALTEFDMKYIDFEQRVLESIDIDGYSLYNFNRLFHGYDANNKKIRAADLRTEANALVIEIQNDLYAEDNVKMTVNYNDITINRTGATDGFISPKGYIFKNTYVMANEHIYKYGVNEMYQKVWKDKTIYNEPCVITEHDDGFYAQLLYTPTRILAVKSRSLEFDYSSEEYRIEGDRIYLTEGSTMPYLTKANINCEDIPDGLGTYPDGKGGEILFTEDPGLISYQVMVTYEHKDTWTGVIPQKRGQELPLLQEKLANHEDITMVVFGDSIFTGSSSTGKLGIPPFVPMFPIGFQTELERVYGSKVTLINNSLGGKTSSWGAETVSEGVLPYNPDLVIVGFGMNDGSGAISAEDYKTNISTIVDTIKASYPDVSIVLAASILANMATGYNRGHLSYVEPLNEIAAANENTTVLDMTTFSATIAEKKNGFELFTNNINHPCDFMVRQYVSNFMHMLEKK